VARPEKQSTPLTEEVSHSHSSSKLPQDANLPAATRRESVLIARGTGDKIDKVLYPWIQEKGGFQKVFPSRLMNKKTTTRMKERRGTGGPERRKFTYIGRGNPRIEL